MKKKIVTICLMLVMCSCRDAHHHNLSEYSYKTPRQHEVLKIMRADYISEYENMKYLTARHRSELQRMKEDYYYELSNPIMFTAVPGPSWEIRGPLTIEQVEEEFVRGIRKMTTEEYYFPAITISLTNKSWARLKNQYIEGDEFYYYESDSTSWGYLRGELGYFLIHNNKVVDSMLVFTN